MGALVCNFNNLIIKIFCTDLKHGVDYYKSGAKTIVYNKQWSIYGNHSWMPQAMIFYH